MALADWWEKIKPLIPNREEATTQARRTNYDLPAEKPPEPTWIDNFVRPAPIAMLVVGGLLTIFTELIGPWAFLGYLLLATAPLVFWLQQIEKRLAEILRRRPDR